MKIGSAYSEQILTERVERALGPAGKTGRVELRTRAWFNENLESRNFFVPGVLVIVVALSTLLLTSMAVVREKEIGTMEQIMVTPITPVEFILGKTVPFALIGFAEVGLVTLIGVFWFEVPIRGNLLLLLLSTGLFLMNTLGVGLLISTFSQTQQQAMMTTFFCFFPAMLLSGFAFPIANMPEPVQWLTLVNPIRYFLVIVRSIFLKGVGVEVLWSQMWPLLAMGLTALFLGGSAVPQDVVGGDLPLTATHLPVVCFHQWRNHAMTVEIPPISSSSFIRLSTPAATRARPMLSAKRCGCCKSASGGSRSFAGRFSRRSINSIAARESSSMVKRNSIAFFEEIKAQSLAELDAERRPQ